jgi:aminopeptidase
MFDHASDEQLTFFPARYYKGIVTDIDHYVAILSDHDMHELDKVNPQKIILAQKSKKRLSEWLDKKEDQGRLTWTLALYGTPSMAKEAGLSLEEYWRQIIKACYLDYADPIAKWRQTSAEIEGIARRLTSLNIQSVHIKGPDADLAITIGDKRRWLGGGGRNIPSFEVFTSPDWRGTEGWIRFNQPLYNYGPKIEGIELHFAKGRVVKALAKKHQKLLREMLTADRGASQLGEFSLTDHRHSHITKFMANTLYDENVGGRFGNTHVAVGRAYRDVYHGDIKTVKKQTLRRLGFNESAVHNDMISTADRTVTAILTDGTKRVIYKRGQFTV